MRYNADGNLDIVDPRSQRVIESHQDMGPLANRRVLDHPHPHAENVSISTRGVSPSNRTPGRRLLPNIQAGKSPARRRVVMNTPERVTKETCPLEDPRNPYYEEYMRLKNLADGTIQPQN